MSYPKHFGVNDVCIKKHSLDKIFWKSVIPSDSRYSRRNSLLIL
jgi:hypothetical protein